MGGGASTAIAEATTAVGEAVLSIDKHSAVSLGVIRLDFPALEPGPVIAPPELALKLSLAFSQPGAPGYFNPGRIVRAGGGADVAPQKAVVS